jgi:hypothetical protein
MTWLTRNLKQTAVYWASPTPDGFGGATFTTGAEIACRWEDKDELFVDRAGQEVRSHAMVYVGQDLDDGGYLYLGDLDDLSSAEEADPLTVTGAYEIRSFQKSPRLKAATEFLRKATL